MAAPTNVREEIARVDENVTDKLTIFGHFVAEQVAQNYTTTMWSSDNVPSRRQHLRQSFLCCRRACRVRHQPVASE